MRGAPHVGFSLTMRKINSRTSLLTGLLPTAFRAREIQLQYSRNPARCQRTTVSGLNKISGRLHRTKLSFPELGGSLAQMRRRCANYRDSFGARSLYRALI